MNTKRSKEITEISTKSRWGQCYLKSNGRGKILQVYFLRLQYYCFGAKDKFSCKGVNKKCNDTNKDKNLNVLLTEQNSSRVNREFRVVNNNMYTYTQVHIFHIFHIFIRNAKFYKMVLARSRETLKVLKIVFLIDCNQKDFS